ncbi:MAG: ATP-binding protein, partial [Candidatus Enteromonas sp.]
FLDEIQHCEAIESPYFDDVKTAGGTKPLITFYTVLNGILSSHKNVDCYVTGSNSKMLSSDILTDFRGRGFEIRMSPLSFSEYLSARNGADRGQVFRDYLRYGGMPFSLTYDDPGDREEYLRSLFGAVYYKDIVERYRLQENSSLNELTKVMASSIGSLINTSRIADTFRSTEGKGIARNTIEGYLGYLKDAFLLEEAERYDIRGRKIIGSGKKYYFADTGLRNALLNFRQPDRGHLMENAIYNELIRLGYGVDVGVIRSYDPTAPKSNASPQLEVNFVVEKGDARYYIQSAFSVDDESKMAQEKRPLLAVRDSFRKILIEGDDFEPYQDDDGVVHVGAIDFLLNAPSILR